MKLSSKTKQIFIIALILAIFSICVFYKTLFKGEIFAWYNDQLFQHNVFYKEWYNIIKESLSSHTLAIYSWDTFLGTDYLASKLMYCVGDFLITPFFVFYSGEINYDLLYCITTIITIVLSGTNMCLYLNKYGIQKNGLIIMESIIYALGGFSMTYTGTYTFHRFYCLLPLLFYFVEKYIQNNKLVGFAFITTVLFLQSYELLFSTCFFLILYFILRYKLTSELTLPQIIKKSFLLIISFFIGIMMTGALLIPLICYLKGNNRVGSLDFGSLFWNLRQIIGFVTNSIIPSFNYRSGNPSYMFYESEHYGSEYGYFATILFILAFIILVKEGDSKEKKCWILGEIIILLCLLVRPINSIIHGFSVPTFRWTFLLEFYHLMVIAYAFDKYEIKNNYLRIISILYVLYILLYVIFIMIYKIDIKENGISVFINLASFAMLYIYYFLRKKILNKVFYLFGIINVMLMYVLSIYSVYGTYGIGEESYENQYLSYLIDNDEDTMFRIYFDSDQLWPYSWLNLNDSINNGYMTTTTYDSTYNSVLNSFLNQNGYDSWMIDIDEIELLMKLGTKYIVSSSEINDERLEYYTNINNFNVYKIIGYHHIGYTEEAELEVIEYNRQYFKGSIDVSSKSTLFVAIPYSDGWNVYDQDGNALETLNIDGGFLGVKINENVSEINFYYGTPGIKSGLIVSTIGVFGLFVLFLKDKTQDRFKLVNKL